MLLHGFWQEEGNLLPLMEIYETNFSESVFMLAKKQAWWCVINLIVVKRKMVGRGGRRVHWAKELYVKTQSQVTGGGHHH